MNNIKEFEIIIGLYFDPLPYFDKVTDFIELSNSICERFNKGQKFNSFNYTFLKSNEHITSRHLRYTSKNIDKMVHKAKNKELIGIEFNISDNFEDIIRDSFITISIRTKKVIENYPGIIILRVKSNFIDHNFIFENFINDLLITIERIKINIDYGIIFPMEIEKIPILFICGMVNESLTREERVIATTWLNEGNQYKDKILDVFWGNIINKKILPQKVINDIEKKLGADYVADIDEGKVYFRLPINILDFKEEKKKYEKYRKEIRKIFEKNKMLIPRCLTF